LNEGSADTPPGPRQFCGSPRPRGAMSGFSGFDRRPLSVNQSRSAFSADKAPRET
jgi:hypothetical protein